MSTTLLSRLVRTLFLLCLVPAALTLSATAQEKARPRTPGDITGLWVFTTPPFGSANWRFVPMGDGSYHAQQMGFLSVSGTARVTGKKLRIDWAKGVSAGYCDFELEADGAAGQGQAVNSKGDGLGTYATTIKLLRPGLIPAAEASLGEPEAYWWCRFTHATGQGAVLVRLYPGGEARSDRTGTWDRGKWTRNGGELWIDWGLFDKFKSDNYLLKLAVSPDGKSLALSPSQKDGNYYLRKLEAVKLEPGKGVGPSRPENPVAQPANPGNPLPGNPVGVPAVSREVAEFLKPKPGETVLETIGPMQMAPPPLPLPPVGTEQRKTSDAAPSAPVTLAAFSPRPLLPLLAAQKGVTISKLTASHVPGSGHCDRGSLKIDLAVTEGARVYAGVYIGGYIKQVSRVMRAPGYTYRRWTPDGLPLRLLSMPHVLPAKIRVELYDAQTNALIDQRAIEFDHPWPNYSVVGKLYGDYSKNQLSAVTSLVTVNGTPLEGPDKKGVLYRFSIPNAAAIKTLSDPKLDETGQRAASALRNYYAFLLERPIASPPDHVLWSGEKNMSDPLWDHLEVRVEPRCGGDRDERDNVRYSQQPGKGWDANAMYKIGF